MRYSKYAILFLLLISVLAGNAQVVTVTDKGDAGRGTLRQALLDVPVGTAGYTIKFDLPGAATEDNRTIRLKSALPPIPSNVTIDGSSQSWNALGVSGAKIIIEPESPGTSFHGLTIGNYNTVYTQVTNVEIYGLFLRNFAKFTSLQNVNTNQGSGIVIDYRATGIKIGAPGKGNVIGGTINGILVANSGYYPTPSLAGIDIQSNLIGLLYDGTTAIPNISGISANLYETNMNIGGDNTGEGNTISANQTNINISRFNSSSTRTSITIVNNNIGVDVSGTKDYHDLQLFLLSSTLEIHGLKVNSIYTDLYLRKNIISGNKTSGVTIANADFALTSNIIGTGINKNEPLGNGVGVRIEGSASGIIGGTVTADLGNVIAHNNYGVELVSNRQVKIMRNSFYCNKQFSIGPTSNFPQAYVQILVKKAGRIEGRATANSEVELFYTENCNGICEGKEYIKTVQVDATGRWHLDDPPTLDITATATPLTLNGTTSQFSTASLLENEALVTSVTCNGKGSIKIPEQREGFTFTWNKIEDDASRTVLIPAGTVQEINDLDVGQYEVVIDDGCKAVARQFLIKDQTLINLVVNWPTPACGQTSFLFSANVDRGEGTVRYQWTNVNTGAIMNGKNVSMPEGTYMLRVTDQVGCTDESGPVEIKRLPSPIINIGSRLVGPAACGEQNGVIKNVVVTDIQGTAIYKWYVMNLDPLTGGFVRGDEVGQSLDLVGVAGGVYMLEVKDAGACPTVRSPYITIPITNSVIINGGIAVGTTCNNSNGAINGIYVTNGDNYKLTANGGGFEKIGTCAAGVPFNITGLAPGNYTLNASNSNTLCTATPKSFTVVAVPILQYSAQFSKSDASCGADNGSIRLNYPNNVKPLPGKYKWENAAGQSYVGTNELIENLPEGSYVLKITDPNGCTSVPLGPYVIERIPLLIVDKSIGQVTDDVCGLGRGSITGVKISGGLPLNGSGANAVYKYTWKDVEGNTVRNTRDLVGIGAGDYYLEVTDQTTCGLDVSKVFTVAAPVVKLPTPTVNSLRVCYATEIMLPILAPDEGVYQMYTAENDALPLMETSNGRFVFKVSKTGDYLVRRKLGTCYSDFTPVHIEVTNDNLEIKNTMTPNGDGMNDFWMITGLPDHKDINIKVYARSGQLVYESVGAYSKPFDGRFRGAELPVGAYYYKIDLRADCKPIAGSITLLR